MILTRAACLVGFSLSLVFGSLAACSSDSSSSPDTSPDASSDAATVVPPGDDAATPSDRDADSQADASASDGGDVDASASDGGDGGIGTTSVEVKFDDVAKTLVVAHFGGLASEADGGMHVEINDDVGGSCPTESSPAPDHMLIVEGFPADATGKVFTEADGVVVALVDVVGDLIDKPFLRAKNAKVTVVAQDTAVPPNWLTIDVNATFEGGTAVGRASAGHCASLD